MSAWMSRTLCIRDAFNHAKDLFSVSDTPRLDLEVLLAHVLQKNRSYLHAWPEHALSSDQDKSFRKLLQRRRSGTPIAYLTGSKEFWSRDFEVNENVLIPRPETELVVEIALQSLAPNQNHKILDLGTGSGNIAITLGLERPDSEVIAVDKCHKALGVARRNAGRLNAENVIFLASSWLDALSLTSRFDLVVSNPPYVAESVSPSKLQGVAREPRCALYAGRDGLDDFVTLISQAKNHLKREGRVIFEHGYDQRDVLGSMLSQQGYVDIECFDDWFGVPRVIAARFSAKHG